MSKKKKKKNRDIPHKIIFSGQLFCQQGLQLIETSQKFIVPTAPNRTTLDYN